MGKIPYQLVSMAAIIRDYDEPEYINDEHYKLTSIADYLYNSADGAFSSHPEDNLLPEFKEVFDQYGVDYFKHVKDDMYAIDSQLTSAAKEDELLADYMDMLDSLKGDSSVITQSKMIRNARKIKASDNPFYDKLSAKDKCIVDNHRKQFSPNTFDVYNALLPYIGEYSSNTGWVGSCDLMRVKDNSTVDGYSYKVIWDNSSTEIDLFSWRINDNPRIAGDYTLMVMPTHGMPIFCDSENDFYRAIRKIFGDGLYKTGN